MKRVDLTPVSSSENQKKVNKKQRTHRFDVTLGESNYETCPEYSYVDLVKNEMRANGHPFEDHDEDNEVAAIAQRFEAKYGPKGLHSGKKSRTQEIDDYYDPGQGYNEEDSFIDNTEDYDEVIPSSLTTQFIGFYINQGQLDFKSLNDDSMDISKEISRKKKTRVLESENNEAIGETHAKKMKSMKRKKRLQESKDGENKNNNSSKTDQGKIILKKKNKLKLNRKPPISDSLNQNNVMNPSLLPLTLSTAATNITTVPTQNKSIAAIATNGSTEVKNEMTVKYEFSAIEETFNAVLRETMNEDSTSKSGEEGKGDNQSTERNTQLPSQLPAELLEAIDNMKKEAKETKEKKFFSTYINKLLLDIELGSHKLPWGSKTAIYNHLSEHLPYGKYTLQRRAKKLKEIQEKDQLKGPLLNLRAAIEKVMPALEEQHGIDVQKAKMGEEMNQDIADVVKEEISTESEGEEKTDNRKKPRGPRRRFQWNAEIRDLLQNIVSTKMKYYSSGKSRSQNTDDQLKAYLDSDIKPLWPQGWMQTRMLFKESKKVHETLSRELLPQGKLRKIYLGIDAGAMTAEIAQCHALKSEDVIEVSSIIDNADENKDTVVINLPNSVASMSQMFQTSILSQSSILSSHINNVNESVTINATTSPMTQIPILPVSPAVLQKVVNVTASLSVKEIVPVSQSDPMKILSNHRKDVGTKSLNPVTSSGGPPGSSTVRPTPATTFNSSYYSFLEARNDINNNNGSTKPEPASSSSASQQPVRTNTPHRNSHQQKMSQQKSDSQQQTVKLKQEKSSKEVQAVGDTQQHNTAVRSSTNVGVIKDIRNSSWTNVSSVVPANKSINPVVAVNQVPANKSINPVVAVNQIPENSNQKPNTGFKNGSTKIQQNHQPLPSGQHQLNILPSKSNQNIVQKKVQSLGNRTSTLSIVSSISENLLSTKAGVSFVSATVSSKQNPQNNTRVENHDSQKASSLANLKSGTVTAGSAQKSHLQQQNIKTDAVVVPSDKLQLNARTAADFTGWSSSKPGKIKQTIHLGKIVTSPVIFSRSSPTAIISQSSKPSGLLHNISSTSVSQICSPSAQKSHTSPAELTTLSAYEKLKTQVQHQEEIEGQALKNLGIAVKLEGSSHSELFGTKSGIHDVKSSKFCSFTSSRSTGNKTIPAVCQSIMMSKSCTSDRAGISTLQTALKVPVSGTTSPRNIVINPALDSSPQKVFRKLERYSESGIFPASGSIPRKIVRSPEERSVMGNGSIPRKSLRSPEGCSVTGNGNIPAVLDRTYQPCVSSMMAQCPPSVKRNTFFKEKNHIKNCMDTRIVVSKDTKGSQPNEYPITKRQTTETVISSFPSSAKDSLSHVHTNNTVLPGLGQRQLERSPLSGRHTVNESMLNKSTNNTNRTLSTSSALDHKNIFTKIEQSIAEGSLPAQSVKIRLPDHSNYQGKYSVSTSKNVNSSSTCSFLQGIKIPSSVAPQRPLFYPKSVLLGKGMTNEQTALNSRNIDSVQHTRCASHQLKECVPRLQNIPNTSRQQSSGLMSRCQEGTTDVIQRNPQSIEVIRHLDQDGNAQISQKAGDS